MKLADGILVTKGRRAIYDAPVIENDPMKFAEEIKLSTQQLLHEINTIDAEFEAGDHGNLLRCQEYLREDRVEVNKDIQNQYSDDLISDLFLKHIYLNSDIIIVVVVIVVVMVDIVGLGL